MPTGRSIKYSETAKKDKKMQDKRILAKKSKPKSKSDSKTLLAMKKKSSY
jgi:hypothetical protein